MGMLYEVRCRGGLRVEIISDALPFRCALCYGPNGVNDAVEYAKFHSRSHDAVIRVYDAAGNIVDAHEHKGDFKEP
jgi:hypothetical protein